MGQHLEAKLSALLQERSFDRVATRALEEHGAELYGLLARLTKRFQHLEEEIGGGRARGLVIRGLQGRRGV